MEDVFELRSSLYRSYAWLARYGHISFAEARSMTTAQRRRLMAQLGQLLDEENALASKDDEA